MKDQVYKVANRLPATSTGGYHRNTRNPQGSAEFSFLVGTTEESLKSFDKLKNKSRRKRA